MRRDLKSNLKIISLFMLKSDPDHPIRFRNILFWIVPPWNAWKYKRNGEK